LVTRSSPRSDLHRPQPLHGPGTVRNTACAWWVGNIPRKRSRLWPGCLCAIVSMWRGSVA